MPRSQKQKRSSASARAPITVKKKTQQPATQDDEELDDSFNLQQLQKRLDAMRKTKADTASYVDKFNENVRKREAGAVAELKTKMDEFNSIYEQKHTEILSIRDDIARTANIEDQALYRAQLQIFRNAQRLMGLTDPLVEIIDFALKTSLKLGEDWPQNVKDAVTIISMAKEDVQKTIANQLSLDTKVDNENLGWGQAVKITNRSMRSVLRHLPTTEADLI